MPTSDQKLKGPKLISSLPENGQWFLVRGLARQAAHWGRFPDLMKTQFPGWDVIDLELPGVGANASDDAPLTVEDTARFVRKEFEQLKKSGTPAYLFSVSLGGMVVAEWLKQSTNDVSGAVLVNSSFRGVSPFYKRLRLNSYKHLYRALTEKNLDLRERHVLTMVSKRPDRWDETGKAWAQIQKESPISYTTFFRQLVAAARYSPPKTPPEVPTLILGSLGDEMVDPSCSEMIAALWKSEFHQHPSAGHDLPHDEPEWVLEKAANWLSKLS